MGHFMDTQWLARALVRIRPPEWTDSLRVFGGLVQTARPMDPPHRELQREPSLKAQSEETRKSHVLGGLILRSFIKIKGREIYLYSGEGRKATRRKSEEHY